MDVSGQKPIFLAANTYQQPIFNKEVIDDPGNLKVSFPQKNSLILSHMAVTMATSGGLLFVLVFCFGFTIFTIFRQKKVSEMKTDFINNMTHEFKTPVSTIMIASEALKDAEIAEDKNRVNKLSGDGSGVKNVRPLLRELPRSTERDRAVPAGRRPTRSRRPAC